MLVVLAAAVVGAGSISAIAVWLLRTTSLKTKVLRIQRVAQAGEDESTRSLHEAAPERAEVLSITRFTKLDRSKLQLPAFQESGPALMSLHDYVSSIHIPGGFDWASAMRTVLLHLKLPLLLPMSDLVPAGTPQDDDAPQDPLQALGGSELVCSILKQVASPLFMYSLAETFNLVKAETTKDIPVDRQATTAFRLGSWGASLAGPGTLPNPFVLETDLPRLLHGLDPNAEPPVATGSQTFDWLPDLSLAQVGRRAFLNDYADKLSHVLAILLNRLAANWMPRAWSEELPVHYTVRVSPGGAAIDTPEGLVRALADELAADLDIKVVSRITGFGMGMSMRNGDVWHNMPVVTPVRTGIMLLEGVAKSSGHEEIVTLLSHAELAIRASTSKFGPFRLGFYLGIGGFTGWQPGNEPQQPWNNSPHMEVLHSKDWTREECFEAIKTGSAVAAVVNQVADRMKLPVGGYGFLGVCNDSVAMLQAALGKQVTVFPCLSAGRIKAAMAHVYREYAAALEPGSTMRTVAEHARTGLLRLPCDVVHEPTTMLDAIRRVEMQIPPVTPYETLEAARDDLQSARRQLLTEGM